MSLYYSPRGSCTKSKECHHDFKLPPIIAGNILWQMHFCCSRVVYFHKFRISCKNVLHTSNFSHTGGVSDAGDQLVFSQIDERCVRGVCAKSTGYDGRPSTVTPKDMKF